MSYQQEMLNFDRGQMRRNVQKKDADAGERAKKMQGFNKRKINLKALY